MTWLSLLLSLMYKDGLRCIACPSFSCRDSIGFRAEGTCERRAGNGWKSFGMDASKLHANFIKAAQQYDKWRSQQDAASRLMENAANIIDRLPVLL